MYYGFMQINGPLVRALLLATSIVTTIAAHLLVRESLTDCLLLLVFPLQGGLFVQAFVTALNCAVVGTLLFYLPVPMHLLPTALFLVMLVYVFAYLRARAFPPLVRFRSTAVATLCWIVAGVFAFGALLLVRIDTLAWLSWACSYGLFAFALNGMRVPRVSLRGALANMATLLLGVTLSAVVLEGGAQLALEDIRKHPGDVHQYHPKYLYTLRPGARETLMLPLHENDPEPVSVTISEQGLRGDFLGGGGDDEFRIALAGDSFTFGWGVNGGETLDRHLETLLRARYPGTSIRVLNAGVSGYGPWQSLGFIKERLLPFRPNVILFQTLVANDISDTTVREGFFLRTFDRDGFIWKFNYHLSWQWQYKTQKWLHEKSVAYCHLERLYGREYLWAEALKQTRLTPVEHGWTIPHPLAGLSHHEIDLRRWYPELERGWELFLEDIIAIRDLCLAEGIDLHFYNVPFPITHDFADYQDPTFHETYELDKGESLLHAFFEAHDIPFFQVGEALREAARDKPEFVFRRNGHLSDAGNRVLAQLVCDFLVDSGTL